MILHDVTREKPNFLGMWHLILPSDTLHASTSLFAEASVDKFFFVLLTPRFAALYAYDENIFRERFLGPPGVTGLTWHAHVYFWGLCV